MGLARGLWCIECAGGYGFRLVGRPDLQAGQCTGCRKSLIVAPDSDFIFDESLVTWSDKMPDKRADKPLDIVACLIGVSIFGFLMYWFLRLLS